MTSLTRSPLMISLVQAAMSLPVFLVVLPAGALADVVDRRKLLLITQLWMVLAAAALGLLTIFGMVTSWLLLALTFILGLGAVMNDPAWQAITPEVVSGRNFASGVALNSAGYNIARAAGPALGGLVIAAADSGAAFLLNALSFFGVILVLYRWRRPQIELPSQRITVALRDGLTHLRESFIVRSVLVRTAVFSFFASAFLALLPLIARPFGAVGFGILLACFGLGAMLGAALLPYLRHSHSADAVVVCGTLLFALASFALGLGLVFWLLCVLCLVAGIGWLQIIACLNVCAQTMSPAWVRARAISMYILVLQGGMAAGSAIWGTVASRTSIEVALLFAACGLVVGLAAIPRYRLAGINTLVTQPRGLLLAAARRSSKLQCRQIFKNLEAIAMSQLDGKVAVITGATSGIGARTAEIFVANGAKVVIAGRRRERGEQLVRKIGDSASFIRTDVSVEADIKAMIDHAVERFGRVDCLINNAGKSSQYATIADVDLEQFDAVIAVHLRAVLAGMKYAARVMSGQRAGSIINVASVNGFRAGLGGHYYSAAKAGSIHLTRCAAMELGEKGIRVNSISPGMIATGAFAKYVGMQSDEADDHPEYAEAAISSVVRRWQPLQCVGCVDDIAQAALFLASDASRFVTGQNLVVDGGVSAGWPIAAVRPDRELFVRTLQVSLSSQLEN